MSYKRVIYRDVITKRNKVIALMLLIIAEEETYRSDRYIWTSPYLLKRKGRSLHYNLFLELAFEDPDRFRRCLRMNTDLFENLLKKVAPLIQKQETILRESIPPDERLSLTLRHLATGESQESLLTYRIGQSTISGIIKEVCAAIINVLQEEYLRMPSCDVEWKVVANDFGQRWNFYNCVGAMDGKHVRIDPPLKSGSLYYNYKEYFSVVLLAVVDAQLRFMYVDVGANGRISDSGIWKKYTLKVHLDNNSLKLPEPAPLPNVEKEFPFVLLGDEGFPLSTKVLIPYPRHLSSGRRNKRIFNYRLSRARRCSENAFGILGARFQIFRAAMRYDPDDATRIILACCCIHNMLRTEVVGRNMYTPSAFLDEEDELMCRIQPGEWRQEPAAGMINLGNQGGNRHANAALQLRDEWCDYFNGVGAVPWQEQEFANPQVMPNKDISKSRRIKISIKTVKGPTFETIKQSYGQHKTRYVHDSIAQQQKQEETLSKKQKPEVVNKAREKMSGEPQQQPSQQPQQHVGKSCKPRKSREIRYTILVEWW